MVFQRIKMSEKEKAQDKKELIEYLVKEISRHRYLYYNAQKFRL